MSRPILYFAPGGGLGHLNRGLAVCLELRARGADARIVTDSPFAEGIAALSRCPVIRISPKSWIEASKACVAELAPRTVITDTFPYGLREEWRLKRPAAVFIHMARRLREPIPIHRTDFNCVVQAEPLSPLHEAALGPLVRLRHPIVLSPGRLATPIPKELRHNGVTLVVHSGPPGEIETLARLADGPCTILNPWHGTQYYPASNLFPYARKILTGAGYNAAAEGLAWKDRHTAVAFPRRFDDQAARLQHFFREPGNGTAEAVNAIMGAEP